MEGLSLFGVSVLFLPLPSHKSSKKIIQRGKRGHEPQELVKKCDQIARPRGEKGRNCWPHPSSMSGIATFLLLFLP